MWRASLLLLMAAEQSKLAVGWEASAARLERIAPDAPLAQLLAPVRLTAADGPFLFAAARDARYRVAGDGVVEFLLDRDTKLTPKVGEEFAVAGSYPGESKAVKLLFRRVEDAAAARAESAAPPGSPVLHPGYVAAQVVVAHLGRTSFTFLDVDANGYFDDWNVDAVLVGEPDALDAESADALRARLQTFQGFLESSGHKFLVGLRPATRLVSCPVGANVREDYLRHMGALNHLRREGGLPPVGLDESLTAGCEAHAHYCAKNGLGHAEERSKPGFSPEGDRAGRASVVGTGANAAEGLHGMFQTLFHRNSFLWPGLTQVGVGCAEGQYVCDIHSHTSEGTTELISYPFDRQTDVSPFGSLEFPDERPSTLEQIEGTLVALLFDPGTRPEFVDGRIVDVARNEDVPFAFTSPTQPAPRAKYMFPTNDGAICLFPRERLRGDAIYEVHLRYRKGSGAPTERVWKFWTAK